VEGGQSLLLLGPQGTFLYTPIPFVLYIKPSYTYILMERMEPLILGLPKSRTDGTKRQPLFTWIVTKYPHGDIFPISITPLFLPCCKILSLSDIYTSFPCHPRSLNMIFCRRVIFTHWAATDLE
jgi:hypothetical protein